MPVLDLKKTPPVTASVVVNPLVCCLRGVLSSVKVQVVQVEVNDCCVKLVASLSASGTFSEEAQLLVSRLSTELSLRCPRQSC